MYQDTIAAISTPIGEGGIGIVRLSGQDACSIVATLFDGPLSDHRLVYGHIMDPESSEVIDEVLVSYMAAPRTYTKEDVVEINCHGGPIPLQRVLGLMLHYGARLAEPGEFTLRAFINGRIDLSQAESVLDIIQSKTQAGLQLAVSGLEGKLSRRIKILRHELLDILAYLTARIDFPEHEIEAQDTKEPITKAIKDVKSLLAEADAGIIYRQGVRTVLVGRPNVGKSSLLNRLLRENRSIVTPLPGTTRDTVEEVVNINGIPFLLIDTAGISHSTDTLDALGMERSRQAVTQADLVLLILDASQPTTEADESITELIGSKTALVAANKCDLQRQACLDTMIWPIIPTSALTGEGIDTLEKQMRDAVLGGKPTSARSLLVTNVRHKGALQRTEHYLVKACESMENNMPDDFVTIDLAAAIDALGEITGETVTEGLLETIFSQFCIGK